MPLWFRLGIGALLAGAGVALLVVAILGARGRLPRNRFAGVRTRATLDSEAAFALANRVAAAPVGAAGLIAGVGGTAVLLARSASAGWLLLGLTGVAVLAMAGVGGACGDRAAAALNARAPEPSPCTGSCAGCDLVAGCRPGSPTDQLPSAITSPRSRLRP